MAGDVTLNSRLQAGDKFLISEFDFNLPGQKPRKDMMITTQDPYTNRLISWIFDSEGGFGRAVWTRDGDRWLVSSYRTEPGGVQVTATNVITPTGANGFTWKTTARTVNGVNIKDGPEISVARVASR